MPGNVLRASEFAPPPNNVSPLSKEVVMRSIQRLDSFLNYLSEKIKANTLKISACDKPDTASDRYSGTTASHSDLSIDDVNLNRFKEYMLNSDRKVHGHSVRHQT